MQCEIKQADIAQNNLFHENNLRLTEFLVVTRAKAEFVLTELRPLNILSRAPPVLVVSIMTVADAISSVFFLRHRYVRYRSFFLPRRNSVMRVSIS